MEKDEQIQTLVKRFKRKAKPIRANGNDMCTINELNTAIDKTAEPILKVSQILSID